jgi:hypothetical protein
MNLDNACCQLVQNILSSRCHAVPITEVLPAVMYGCETWFVTLREQKHKVRVFEKTMEVTG